MKIAFLHYHHLLHSRGAETYLNELSRRLSAHHQVDILSHPSPIFISRSRLNLLQRLFIDKVSLSVASWTISQFSKLMALKPQVVIALNGGWQTAILRLWTRINGQKLIISGQSGPGWDDRWNLLWHPDLFICLTRTQLHWAKHTFHWPQQQFDLIPNGVDLKLFHPVGQSALLHLQKPIILLAAAAEESKRVEQGIRAVNRLKKASLVWLGTGPLEQQLVTLGNDLLGPNRFHHASVPHQQMPEYYRAANIFTLCSRSSEAFGIVYLEALATNLPIVATKDASRREIVGNAGVFVKNPDHIIQYAQKLETALSRRWKNTPRDQALKYSWDKIAQLYEKAFIYLLSSPTSPADSPLIS